MDTGAPLASRLRHPTGGAPHIRTPATSTRKSSGGRQSSPTSDLRMPVAFRLSGSCPLVLPTIGASYCELAPEEHQIFFRGEDGVAGRRAHARGAIGGPHADARRA